MYSNILQVVLLSALFSLSYALVPLEDFYPWGAVVHDNNLADNVVNGLDDGSSPKTKFNHIHSFKFFTYEYDSLWVNINGAVSFSEAIREFTPTCAPLGHYMNMIAPFWADVDLRTGKGNISHRETTEPAVLNKALTDVKTAFPEYNIAEIKWAYVVTWYKVPFFDDTVVDTKLSNTFQLVLATDGFHSFAIFNYNNIEWTTGTHPNSGGDNNGRGGHPARAGFDNGEGKLYILPESCSPSVINIASQTVKNGPGKFVFRVDDDTIVVPGPHQLSTITGTPPTAYTDHTKNTEPTTEPTTESTNTEPSTQPATEPSTSPHTTISEEEEFKKRLVEIEERLRQLRIRLITDCDRLIERPALENECYHELEKLNNLIHELKLTKYLHELGRIELELEKIVMVLDKIEKDISFYF